MKSPKLLKVLKIPLTHIINNNFNLQLTNKEKEYYCVEQQSNQLFEFVQKLTNNYSNELIDIVFVECKNGSSKPKQLKQFLSDGFYINNMKYTLSVKSASMSRQSTVSMVTESISEELEKIILNGIELEETVLAKYLAYMGLTLSSSFSLGEDFTPYTIVVDDYEKIIPNQTVRCLSDRKKEYIDKNGIVKTYKEKIVTNSVVNVDVMPMDGWGCHSPRITSQIKNIINIKEYPTTVMWRNAYFKGLTSEIDFVGYCENVGVHEIEDIYGVNHSIYDIDIIATKSMFKGYNYYNKFGKTYEDWLYYLENCKKNGYTWRIAKWTYSFEEEPRATRNNYQHLQCLDINSDDFISLADYTKEWIEKIFNGDKVYLYTFLGLFGDKQKPLNSYMKALLKNPETSKDPMVKKYLSKMLKKNINQMKIGKIYMPNSTFKTAIPDVVLFLEHITKQEPKGILEANEFYAVDINGVLKGEYFVGRNPKISKREQCVLKGSDYDILNKYASHLSNTVMINARSTIMARMQGFDFDGDNLLLIPNKLIANSIDMSMPIIMDTEDKATARKQKITKENIVENTIMSFKSLIGEYSNYASAYNNRIGKTQETKQKYQDFVDILSVCSGKALDYAKCGILYLPPPKIAKYAKPLPYFMKYISPYYANMKKFSYSPSNMNLLAYDIEKWERGLKKLTKSNNDAFDYSIMKDNSIPWNSETFLKVEELYKQFQYEFKELKKQQRMSYKNPEYYNYFGESSQEDVINTSIDWNDFFNKYKKLAKEVCKNEKELANYTVELCYQKESNDKSFAWVVSENGVLDNIVPIEHELPIYDPNGEYEYLGKRYSLVPYKYDETQFENQEELNIVNDEDDYFEGQDETQNDPQSGVL